MNKLNKIITAGLVLSVFLTGSTSGNSIKRLQEVE